MQADTGISGDFLSGAVSVESMHLVASGGALVRTLRALAQFKMNSVSSSTARMEGPGVELGVWAKHEWINQGAVESTRLLDLALGLSGSSSSTEKSRCLGRGAVIHGPRASSL